MNEEELRALSPAAIEAFLTSEDWRTLHSPFPRASVWANKNRTERLIVLPTTRSVDDYVDRIAEALRTIARAYGGSDESWLERLSAVRHDVLSFQEVTADSARPGTIGIAEGAALFVGVRDTLSAGLKSSLGRSPYFGQRFWPEAKEFLSRARFGQTRSGSYVVTVMAGGVSDSQDTDILGTPADRGDVEAQRRITSHIMRALDAAKQILQLREEGDDEVLQLFVDKGVSADLLAAIRRMTPWREGGEVTVTVQWSPLVPVETDVPDEVSFSSADRPSLELIDTRLKESQVILAAEIVGHIEMLRRDVAEQQPGQVTLVASRGPVRRGAKIRIRFDEADYERAIDAHQARAWVRVVGDLTKSRTRFWLRNLAAFDIVPDTRLFRQ